MFVPIVLGGAAALCYTAYESYNKNKRDELRGDINRTLNDMGFRKRRSIKFYGGISPLRWRRYIDKDNFTKHDKNDDCDNFHSFGNIELRIDTEHRRLAFCQYIPRKYQLRVLDFDDIIEYRIIETSPGSPKMGKTKSSSARSSALGKSDGSVDRMELHIITKNIMDPIVVIKLIDRETRASSNRYKNAVWFIDQAYATIVSIIESNKRG